MLKSKLFAMKKLFLFLFLTCISGPSHASWTLSTENEIYTLYSDRTRIQREGDFRRMWTLANLHKVEVVAGKGFISWIRFDEYDCRNKRSRPLKMNFYNGQMGSGNLVYSLDPDKDWSFVVPNSTGEKLLNIACSKK